MAVVSSFLGLRCRNWLLLGSVLFWGATVFLLLFVKEAGARFASRLSLSTGEEYNDNIFFNEDKKADFVTVITPTLSFLHQRGGQNSPIWNADLSAAGQIYARHSELNNFGDRLTAQTSYFYPYSSRLTVRMSDCLERRGATRLGAYAGGGLASSGGFGRLSTQGGFSGVSNGGCGSYGSIGSLSTRTDQATSARNIDVVGLGETLENRFSVQSGFQYSPTLNFGAMYSWRYMAFFDEGGMEQSHAISLRGTYSRWRQHNLYASYGPEFFRSREGGYTTIHNIDFGDDFLTSRQIQLTPTLSLFASTGLALRTNANKFGVTHRMDVSIAKLWRTALLAGGVRRGLTGSYGIDGISYTTGFYGYFHIYLSRRLLGVAAVDFSMFETETTRNDFRTFQVVAGLQYWITNWLSANLAYNYRQLTPDNFSAADSNLRQLKANANSIFIALAAHFDLWPNFSLARGMAASQLMPPAAPGVTTSSGPTAPASPIPQGPTTP